MIDSAAGHVTDDCLVLVPLSPSCGGLYLPEEGANNWRAILPEDLSQITLPSIGTVLVCDQLDGLIQGIDKVELMLGNDLLLHKKHTKRCLLDLGDGQRLNSLSNPGHSGVCT